MEKEDFLEVDARIPGQNYVCLSVLIQKIYKKSFLQQNILSYI